MLSDIPRIRMKALKINPINKDQEKAIKLFLDALHVKYEQIDEVDATIHLTSSSAMVERLNESIQQAEEGKVRSFSRADLWK